MKHLALIFVAVVSLLSSGVAIASSVYDPLEDLLMITNDSSDVLSLKACKNIEILRHQGNVWAWGKGRGELSAALPLSDQDWKGSRLELVKAIRGWKRLPISQKLERLPADANRDEARRCFEFYANSWGQEAAMAEIKLCRSRGKELRDTSKGRLCLSDFEYAQIMLLEDQQKSIDNYKRKEMQQRRDQMQAEEAYRQEQQRQKRIEESYRRNKEFLDSLRPKDPVRCSGTYNQFGTYSYSCK